MLYIVDEVFFVGTAVEVTPIRSVDHIQVGKGVADRSPEAPGRVLRHYQRQQARSPQLAHSGKRSRRCRDALARIVAVLFVWAKPAAPLTTQPDRWLTIEQKCRR